MKNSEIERFTKIYISSHANYPTEKIKDEFILKKSPLKLDDTKLSFLALSLRGYLKMLNDSATILAQDLRKKDVSVKDICDLMIKRKNNG